MPRSSAVGGSLQCREVCLSTSHPTQLPVSSPVLHDHVLFVFAVCAFFSPSPLPLPETRCLPMALSSFSHYSIIHMVANMYVLWIFSSGIVSLLGKEQFLAVYLSAGESNKAHNWSLITFIKSKHNTLIFLTLVFNPGWIV